MGEWPQQQTYLSSGPSLMQALHVLKRLPCVIIVIIILIGFSLFTKTATTNFAIFLIFCICLFIAARRLTHISDDPSVMTYRGHSVLQTLVRAKFSPPHNTGQVRSCLRIMVSGLFAFFSFVFFPFSCFHTQVERYPNVCFFQ